MKKEKENTTEKSMGELLSGFRRAIKSCLKKNILEEELTLSQMETLIFIGPKDKKTMESISTHLDISPPSATSLIGKLVKNKMVIRKNDKIDRRIVYIELSTKTKKELVSMWQKKEKALDTLVSKLSITDRNHFKRILNTLIN
jgi:DNA-binding MarR family transcriptional regulator